MTAPPHTALRSATRATYLAFVSLGFASASFAGRLPQIRQHLHLTPASLGLVLLSSAVGSLVALPLSGPVVAHYGSRRTVTGTSVLASAGLAVIGIGTLVGVPMVVAGLFLLGLGFGAWDVAMNVHGALVERDLERSIMSRFHAGYSVGTVGGALVGAVVVAVGVPVTAHLCLAAVLVAITVPVGVRSFLDNSAEGPGAGQSEHKPARASALAAWREPRTLLVGLFVFCFAFAEGTGNDWIGIATIGSRHVSAAVGTLTFAVFLTAMTIGRWFGPGLLDRYGRVPVLRACTLVGIAGTAVFVFVPSLVAAFVGVALWGAGVALGFPVGMSAGADEPERAASRVSVIASLGYCAFFVGPPLVGFLGDHVAVVSALAVVMGLFTLASLISGATRPPVQALSGQGTANSKGAPVTVEHVAP